MSYRRHISLLTLSMVNELITAYSVLWDWWEMMIKTEKLSMSVSSFSRDMTLLVCLMASVKANPLAEMSIWGCY